MYPQRCTCFVSFLTSRMGAVSGRGASGHGSGLLACDMLTAPICLHAPSPTRPAGTSLAEVDSVLATTEVQQLLDEEGLSLALLPEADRDVSAAGVAADDRRDGSVHGYPGGAGGYLEFIYRCWQSWSLGSGPCRGLAVLLHIQMRVPGSLRVSCGRSREGLAALVVYGHTQQRVTSG